MSIQHRVSCNQEQETRSKQPDACNLKPLLFNRRIDILLNDPGGNWVSIFNREP